MTQLVFFLEEPSAREMLQGLLPNPSEELKRLVPEYQKISGPRAIGPHLDIDNNHSRSFNALVIGVRRLVGKRHSPD